MWRLLLLDAAGEQHNQAIINAFRSKVHPCVQSSQKPKEICMLAEMPEGMNRKRMHRVGHVACCEVVRDHFTKQRKLLRENACHLCFWGLRMDWEASGLASWFLLVSFAREALGAESLLCLLDKALSLPSEFVVAIEVLVDTDSGTADS